MRQPTPNVLDALMPERSETFVIRQALLWNYDQLGDAAETVITHAVEIKRHERRANESVIEAGRHLIAVKESLTHGQWGDWLQTEFAMTDRTAQTLMSIANRFDGKSEIISDLSTTVLGLLAAPSVPDAAVAAVIDASANGKITVATAKTIIEQHKPTPRRYESGLPALNMPAPPTTPDAIKPPPSASAICASIDTLYWEAAPAERADDRVDHLLAPENFDYYLRNVQKRLDYPVNQYAVTNAIMELVEKIKIDAADDRPLPTWATEPEPLTAADLTIMQPAPNLQSPISQSPNLPDPRIAQARRLIDLYRAAIGASQQYGDLTGHHTETLPLERCAEKLISRLQRMVDMLSGTEVGPIEEEETWG